MPIINSSKLYIGNDTGFMHLSAGLNVPSIGLFGDTPLSYANYNKNILLHLLFHVADLFDFLDLR